MRKVIYFKMIGCVLWIFSSLFSYGQDDPIRVYMYLNYYQSSDQEYLQAETKYRDENRQFQQLGDIEVEFYWVTDTADVFLGKSQSGENGITSFDLSGIQYKRDSMGKANFEAVFTGNDTYRKADRDVETVRASLALSLEIVDSVKKVLVSGTELVNGSPIEDVDLQLLVKRTFSNLPIAEGSFEDGKWEVEFPNDIPGDAFGDLEIIALITEHDEYGTVEVREKAKWGIPITIEPETSKRALWGRPPIWIIVAVTAAFSAAWIHYLMAIYNLFKIRKQSMN